jgi:hypothetical protein
MSEHLVVIPEMVLISGFLYGFYGHLADYGV